MTLPQRLLLGSLVLVSLLVAAIVALSGGRLERRLIEETTNELTRETRLIALLWKPGANADALADSAGAALQRRVTLIDAAGVVRGDSKFDGEELEHLEITRHVPRSLPRASAAPEWDDAAALRPATTSCMSPSGIRSASCASRSVQ